MKTLRALATTLALAVMALLGSVLGAPSAHADESTPASWRITRHATDARIQADGTAQVTTTIDFDFAHTPGHGPYLTFVTRQALEDDPSHWRMIDISSLRVTSPTGAPTQTQRESADGAMLLRVGSPSRMVRGVQTYVVSYTLRGIVDPRNAVSGLDEVNWSVIGTGWSVPISNASVSLHLPGATPRLECHVGRLENCTSIDAANTTFRQSWLPRNTPMRVVAGLPAGTFVGAEPRLEHRTDLATAINPAGLGGVNGIAGLLVALTGALGIARTVRRSGRDEVFTGEIPGASPTDAATAPRGRAAREMAVAVAFTPPKGTTPGEIGLLVDKDPDGRDVVATVVDLAVRGFIRITEAGEQSWVFERTGVDESALLGHEQVVMRELFRRGGRVTTDELASASHAELLPRGKKALTLQVVAVRRWFRNDPKSARATWQVAGLGVVALGAALFALGLGADLSLPGAALVCVGIAVFATSRHAGARTAEGSAVLAQARGFELYLRTAEADQLRFEEGEDIFSRYLPWAIMFGVAERWTRLFEKLAAEGRWDAQPGWYVGNSFGYGYFYGGIGSLGSAITSSMQSSFDAAQRISSTPVGGGSGFSGGGGGGFGGGGGGGW